MVPDSNDFLRLAEEIAGREARRAQPIFGLLTGSAAWGTTSSRSDIDIIFVSPAGDAVSYRYYMPELAGVAIRTEVGRIPAAHLDKVLASGYGDEISTGLREQIANARILLGDRARAEEVIAAFAALKPRKKLLGEYLFQASEAARKAAEALDGKRLLEAALAMDGLARNAWRLELVAGHQVGVQKEKHEIRAARRHLDRDHLTRYETSRRISGITPEAARRSLEASAEVISKVLELAGISSRIVGAIDA